eukprot:5916148-Amphidinium_carterae.1
MTTEARVYIFLPRMLATAIYRLGRCEQFRQTTMVSPCPSSASAQVLKLLPSTWTLANLAEYLSKAGRFAVHERRENLSSMAYLKTFTALAQAPRTFATLAALEFECLFWCQERMRKVSITGDRPEPLQRLHKLPSPHAHL